MQYQYYKNRLSTLLLFTTSTLFLSACSSWPQQGVSLKRHTDAIYTVVKADHRNYINLIVKRLGPEGAGILEADEDWQHLANKAPLSAQMLKANAEAAYKINQSFRYQQQSLWPINKQNLPQTPIEKRGHDFVLQNPGEYFYGRESVAGKDYFVAVYPDIAVSPSCTTCHNEHKQSPRNNFQLGDIMGAIVVRVGL